MIGGTVTGRVLLALVLIAFASSASAQADPVVVTQQRTPSGLTFRHVHMPDDTHQAIGFAWKDGSAVSLPGKEALPGLATALMMEGPKGSTRSAMIEDLRDLQAAVGLSAGASFTLGALSAPRARFAAAGQIMARVLADPALPEDKLIEAQRNRATASQQGAQNAETLALWLFQRLIAGDGPYWRSLGADPAIYGRVTKADIEAWRRDVLVRDGLVLVAVGPMDATEIARELDRIFASLPESGQQPVLSKPVLHSSGKLVVLEKAVVQTAIAIGAPTTLTVTPDLARAELAVDVLSRGFSSRLMRAVRERLGAAYGISATLQQADAQSRTLVIRTPVANDKAKAALAAIRDEYALYVAEGATDDEVEPLKTVHITRHQERLQRSNTVATALLASTLNGFPDDYLATFAARVRSYTRAAVNDDIFTRLPKPPLTTVMVAPSAEGLDADCVIKALAEIARCE
jgi:zinc protease